ncbi:MAG: ABC transporter ATPase [Flavobacteriaceae bacterium]|mgnify:CR=1 FL=1
MFVSFNKLPDHARVWIYQSNQTFNENQISFLTKDLESFLSQWTAHNQELEASFEIPYNRFIVLAVNEKKIKASGCSIDASVRYIKKIENKMGVILLDKMNVILKNNNSLVYKSLESFKKMYKGKQINKETIVFNNLVKTVEEYKNIWEIELKNSWHNKFVKNNL